jgi:hypothetical protein
MPNTYFYGKGRVYFAEKDASSGAPKTLNWSGNVKKLTVALATEVLKHNESYTGENLEDVRLPVGKSAEISADVENFDLDQLAMGLYGEKVTVDGDDIAGETLPAGLAVGDEIATQQPKISAVAVKDSAGTPATLVLDTDYSIEDAATGRIKILNIGSYVQPFKIDYTYGARKDVGMFTKTAPERWLRYEGINLTTGTKAVVNLYRVQIDPMSELPLITEGTAVAGYTMKGAALLDSTQPATAALGQFGNIQDLA